YPPFGVVSHKVFPLTLGSSRAAALGLPPFARRRRSTVKSRYEEFTEFRRKMNERILEEDNRVLIRVFALDSVTYRAGGALDVQNKDLLGRVASLVLRCDDCVSYHVAQSTKAGARRDKIMETMSIGLVGGGSILIPHLRRAVAFL